MKSKPKNEAYRMNLETAWERVRVLEEQLEARNKELIALTPTTPPTPAKFSVGDPVSRHGGTWLDFVSEVKWVEQRGWVYGINYSQRNQCSLCSWQGGGFGFYDDEKELKEPVGREKLIGELWRELRSIQVFHHKIKESESKVTSLRFALTLMGETDESVSKEPNPKEPAAK